MSVPNHRVAELAAPRPPLLASSPDMRDLVARFPLPAAILRADGSLEFVNAAARREVAAASLTACGPQVLELAAQGQAGTVSLHAPGSRPRLAMVHAAPAGTRVVAVFDPEQRAATAAVAQALHRRAVELERTTVVDRLTGMWNRRYYDHAVTSEIAFAEEQSSPLTLVVLDLDQFHSIVARCGDTVGDDVLRLAATRLRAGCRPTDLIFHWDHARFAVLLPATPGVAAAAVAERLRQRMSAREMPLAGNVTLSAGVAEYRNGEGPGHWLERAQGALHVAMEFGRDRVRQAGGGAPPRAVEAVA